jgi:predicted NUDIX family phosphoesterase
MTNKNILVVPTDNLFGYGMNKFQGYKNSDKDNYLSEILQFKEWHPRIEMEINPLFKQPIAYSLIVNPDSKKIFSYQRAKKDKDYGEKRLQGKWSWGIGGHIEASDEPLGSRMNIIEYSMLRELYEETGIDSFKYPALLGYLNDDSNDVGKVHFGLLYLIETDKIHLTPNDPEVTNGKFRTLGQLEDIMSNEDNKVEEWSKIALGPLKKYGYL